MKFQLQYIPLDIAELGAPDCSSVELFALRSSAFILGTYPVSEEWDLPGESRAFEDHVSCVPLSVASGYWALGSLQELSWFAGEVDVSHFDMFVGVAPPDSLGGALGLSLSHDCCYYHGVVVVADELTGTTTAHEIAHSIRGWVPSDHPEYTGGGHFTIRSPGFWPDKKCEMGWFAWQAASAYPAGCDPGRDAFDFMSAYGPSPGSHRVRDWVSKDTWEHLASSLTVQTERVEVIGMSLRLLSDGRIDSGPWYRFRSTPDVQLDGPGEFRILYLDGAGTKLGETGFDGFGQLRDSPLDIGFAALRIPYVTATERILIQRGDEILLERTISPSSPQVKITRPRGGELYGDGELLEVEWDARDGDGDRLHYLVFLSTDLGRTWLPIASGLDDARHAVIVPPSLLSSSVLIKVVATDGVNSGEDILDLPFLITPFESVPLDIKPGSDPNPVACNRDDVIVPVALLSTADFDTATVDHRTVRFGKTGIEAQEVHVDSTGAMRRHVSDVNEDGLPDLIFHFKLGDTGISCGDQEAVIRGLTYEGQAVLGRDGLVTVSAP